MARVWLSAWHSCVPLRPTVRMVQHNRWDPTPLSMPSGRAVVAASLVGYLPGLCLISLWSELSQNWKPWPCWDWSSALRQDQRVFPKSPCVIWELLKQELTKVLIGAGISTRWFMGHHDCFFLKVRSSWPSSRGWAMGRLYCGRQSSVPSGTEGTSDWVGDSWCLQWKKRNLVLGLGPHKLSYNVSLPVRLFKTSGQSLQLWLMRFRNLLSGAFGLLLVLFCWGRGCFNFMKFSF